MKNPCACNPSRRPRKANADSLTLPHGIDLEDLESQVNVLGSFDSFEDAHAYAQALLDSKVDSAAGVVCGSEDEYYVVDDLPALKGELGIKGVDVEKVEADEFEEIENPRRVSHGFTIANIKADIRKAAPYIAGQYSALWPEMITGELIRIERKHGERMSDQVFDEMHNYGIEQVGKHGLPGRENPFQEVLLDSYHSPEVAKIVENKLIQIGLHVKRMGRDIFVHDDQFIEAVKYARIGLKDAGVRNPGHRGVHTAKFDRCVEDVKAGGYADDPYAVCQASLGEGAIRAGHRRNPYGGKRNPESSSDSLYETFHGEPPTESVDIVEEVHEHEHLAGLGDLIEMIVVTPFEKEITLTAPDPETANVVDVIKLASNEDANQLYLVGGDQEIDTDRIGFKDKDVRDKMLIGVITQLTYRTKKGFDKFKEIDYFHKLGEEQSDGVQPVLLYDPISKLMEIAGGRYKVKDVGIVG